MCYNLIEREAMNMDFEQVLLILVYDYRYHHINGTWENSVHVLSGGPGTLKRNHNLQKINNATS